MSTNIHAKGITVINCGVILKMGQGNYIQGGPKCN